MARHITNIPHFSVKHELFRISFLPSSLIKWKNFWHIFRMLYWLKKRLGSNSNIYYYSGKSLNIITRVKLELGHLHKSSKPFKYDRHYLILYYPRVPLKQPSINSFIYISSTYTRFESKSRITRCVKLLVLGILTRKNLFKEIGNANKNGH